MGPDAYRTHYLTEFFIHLKDQKVSAVFKCTHLKTVSLFYCLGRSGSFTIVEVEMCNETFILSRVA